MKNKFTKRGLIQFLICCSGGSIGYGVYMLHNSFYDAFLEGYGITNTELSALVSIYASVAMFTYFLGGIVCDKVSARKMVTLSWLVNGLCTMYLATFPSYGVLKVVYGIMGLCATFTFWSPLQKVTRQMGKNIGGEGKAFGGVEGGRAFAEIILGTIAISVAAVLGSALVGLRFSLVMCGGVLTACGVAAWFAFTDEEDKTAPNNNYNMESLIACLKNPCVWVQAFALLGCYAITSSLGGYASKMATAGFGATAATAAFIGMCNSYTKPIGAIGGGIISDKLGRSKTLALAAGGMGACALIVFLMPKSAAMLIPFTILYAIMIVFVGVARGNFYSPLGEGGVPMTYMGTAVGVVATVGYLPDVFLSRIFGRILDTYEGVEALNIIMLILVAFSVFAIAMCFLFMKIAAKRAQKVEA